ncbi:MAG TPA: proton-conducting transporter membrane subunit [Bacteroidales bacterium]|nr:proton-conducting transporter membrane subunit [Bacteroidales bacterium]
MESTLIELFNLLALFGILLFPFFKINGRGIIALSVITIQVLIASFIAVSVFTNGTVEFAYLGSYTTGTIPIRVDYLSAWFLLVISFTFLTGAWYGFQYMKQYLDKPSNLTLHAVAFILLFTSLIDLCLIQNSLVMLVVWEIMALSSFITIVFESHKTETLKAGINFLIQSHICILFLTFAFMWVKVKTGSFDFQAITTYTASQPALIGIGLFIFFFIGFGIKAGFVPFHTWLPKAHPAAPAHISGIMSGVIIKIGIYGILRILMLIKTDMITLGYFVLFMSTITGVYGVALAIIQHNLKKLLAYHSIENIGIIGIGIGMGCLGLGYHNTLLVVTGFGGALLHTLNHSLFKSLLFFSAGNVYQAKHTMNIEAMGGLLKAMPRTGYLFLIGSLAICGLPPFNGFISEFFLYSGLFHGLYANQFLINLFLLFVIFGLVLIGGLALICFTKAFGIVFLGTPREKTSHPIAKEKNSRIFPMYLVALFILFIGLFPFIFNAPLLKTVALYQPILGPVSRFQLESIFGNLSIVGWYSMGFVGLIGVLYWVRYALTRKRSCEVDNTWGCGYTGETSKMQFTASSFIRSYRKLMEPILLLKKEKVEAVGLYPNKVRQSVNPGDRLERWLIDRPIFFLRTVLSRFTFLQNGNIQAYILYGFIFVGATILIPLIISKFATLMSFLNQL